MGNLGQKAEEPPGERPAGEQAEPAATCSTCSPAEDRPAAALSKPEEGKFSLAALEAEIGALRADLPAYVSRLGHLTVPTMVCNDEGELVGIEGGAGPPWDLTASVTGGDGTAGVDLGSVAGEMQTALRGAECALAEAERRLAATTEEEEGQREERRAAVEEARRDAQQAKEMAKQADAAVERARKAEAYNFPFQVCLRFDETWPEHPPTIRFQCIIHHALTDDSDGMLMPFYRVLQKGGGGVHTVAGMLKAVHDFLADPLQQWGIPVATAPQRLLTSIKTSRQQNEDRLSVIKKYAKMVKHPELFQDPPLWKEEWLDPAFLKAARENTPEAWNSILAEHLPGEVFSFRLFTDEFCAMFVEEVFNFYASGLPARRPNSMNNYGIILNEIGLEPMIQELQKMLQPLGELKFRGPGNVWDGNHCFMVRYREGEDLGLDMHTDDSDVTFNICLGLDFDGAGLQFCGVMGAANHRRHTYTYKHQKGCCVFHLGRKRHGADDITTGERLNMILWNHSSAYRACEEYKNPPYVKEEGEPDQVCVSYTHDRDYGNFKEYPAGKEHFKGRGWCPPKPKEYDGFKPDSEKVVPS